MDILHGKFTPAKSFNKNWLGVAMFTCLKLPSSKFLQLLKNILKYITPINQSFTKILVLTIGKRRPGTESGTTPSRNLEYHTLAIK